MYVGIDFGTTFSSAATCDGIDNVPIMIEGNDNNVYWRATQRFKKKNLIIHGADPTIDPTRTIINNKRLFARHYDEIKTIPNYPYQIKRRGDGGINYTIVFEDGTYSITTPEIVATKSLKHLYQKYIENKFNGCQIKVICTVPAYFRTRQTQAMAKAGIYYLNTYNYLC